MATVIMADVVDSTVHLETLGSEAWVEMMNTVFHLLSTDIYRFGGEIDQYRGDGLLAFFGVPVIHEDDPERAVLAALAMQDSLRALADDLREREGIELRMRVGVNTGEVIATAVGAGDRHREDTAMGLAIAVASRLETAAQPGTVLVSEETYRLVAPLFTWEPLGEIYAKGVRDPLTVYRPLQRLSAHDKVRGIAGLSSALVGRHREFRALQLAAERLQASEGSIVFLVGEAGIGKSRLTAEFRTQVMKYAATGETDRPFGPVRWLEGRCLSYGSSTAYGLWEDIVRNAAGIGREASLPEARERLSAWVGEICSSVYPQVFPYLAHMMLMPLPEETEAELRGLGAEGLKTAVFRAVERLLTCMSYQTPLVLVCEDLHWADPTSLALLEQVLALANTRPMLALCLMRPEREHGCWRLREVVLRQWPQRATDLRLQPLTASQSSTMLHNLLGMEALPETLRQAILDAAEGVPFYVEEILRSLIGRGTIVFDAATRQWISQEGEELVALELPGTLQGVITSRIGALPVASRRVLQLASVIGRVFERPILEALAGDGDLDAHLGQLQRAEMIRVRSRAPVAEYIFKHVLTQEAAYASLLLRERRETHRRIALIYEQFYTDRREEVLDLLAYHWERAGSWAEAVGALMQAAVSARKDYANDEALSYLQRAQSLLARVQAHPSRISWQRKISGEMGQIHFVCGRLPEAEAALLAALDLGTTEQTSPAEQAQLRYWLGETYIWMDRLDDVIRLADEGLALLAGTGALTETALMYQLLATAHGNRSSRVKFVKYATAIEDILNQVPYSVTLIPSYLRVVTLNASFREDIAQALDWLRRMEESSATLHDLRGLAEAHFERGRLMRRSGQKHRALEEFRMALVLFSQIGDTKLMLSVLINLSFLHLATGELDAAEVYLEQARNPELRVTMPWESYAHSQLEGAYALCRGDTDTALRYLAVAAPLERRASDAGDLSTAIYSGWVHIARGDTAAACEAFMRMIRAPFAVSPDIEVEIIGRALEGLDHVCGMHPADLPADREYNAALAELELSGRVESLRQAGFTHLRAEPAAPHPFAQTLWHDSSFTSDVWRWIDPAGDCRRRRSGGVILYAGNERKLDSLNLTAPRLVGSVVGDFAVESVCLGLPHADRPATGGLLLWQDQRNYLTLVRGMWSPGGILFTGRNPDPVIVGRGSLGLAPEQPLWLRLERVGDHVRALCSADGASWLSLGQAAFTSAAPVEVGLLALGSIDRWIYPGAYPDGAAIRFRRVTLMA